jgi:hypothetical protein
MNCGGCILTFRREVKPPSSGSNNWPSKQAAVRVLSSLFAVGLLGLLFSPEDGYRKFL